MKPNRSKPVARIERRLFHIAAASVFPLIALALDQQIMIVLAAVGTGSALVLEISRRRLQSLNKWFLTTFSVLLKKSESGQTLGSSYLLAATLIAFLLFDKEVAILALLYLAIGDPLAALVGQRYGRIKIRKKSLEGALAFAAGAALVSWILIAGGLDASYSMAMAGAGLASIIELMSLPPDDNVTVPLASGGLMMALV